MTEVQTEQEVFDCLRSKVAEQEKQGVTSLEQLEAKLKDDTSIPWDKIKPFKMKNTNDEIWAKISHRWKYYTIKDVVDKQKYTNGGDRVSATYKWKKHNAIAEYVKQQATAAPPTVDDSVVADDQNAYYNRRCCMHFCVRVRGGSESTMDYNHRRKSCYATSGALLGAPGAPPCSWGNHNRGRELDGNAV